MGRTITIISLALAACGRDPEPAPAPVITHEAAHVAARVAPARPKELAHVTIKALGMYCEESCPMRVHYALGSMKEIYELGFDLPNESIFVSYDAALGAPKQVTKPMLLAIKQAGFDPWLAKETWPADAKVQVVTHE